MFLLCNVKAVLCSFSTDYEVQYKRERAGGGAGYCRMRCLFYPSKHSLSPSLSFARMEKSGFSSTFRDCYTVYFAESG